MSGGARAQICADAASWKTFLDTVANAVVATSQIACTLAVPPPPSGTSEIDPSKVNVAFVTQQGESVLFQVDGPAGPVMCDPIKGGWYYDDPKAPTQINLCPFSCKAANDYVGAGKAGKIDVTFGCNSIKPLRLVRGGALPRRVRRGAASAPRRGPCPPPPPAGYAPCTAGENPGSATLGSRHSPTPLCAPHETVCPSTRSIEAPHSPACTTACAPVAA
jgi:hypothetical protein